VAFFLREVVVESEAHRALAFETAAASFVLLKNVEATLPLSANKNESESESESENEDDGVDVFASDGEAEDEVVEGTGPRAEAPQNQAQWSEWSRSWSLESQERRVQRRAQRSGPYSLSGMTEQDLYKHWLDAGKSPEDAKAEVLKRRALMQAGREREYEWGGLPLALPLLDQVMHEAPQIL
jgi:beta-glucosidase-like glycosyl hydrolase